MHHALKWTNQRASLDCDALDVEYSSFELFTLEELMKHIGLYLLHGLSRSPQVEMKFKAQSEDPVNGNDFVHSSFGVKIYGKSDKTSTLQKIFCFTGSDKTGANTRRCTELESAAASNSYDTSIKRGISYCTPTHYWHM